MDTNNIHWNKRRGNGIMWLKKGDIELSIIAKLILGAALLILLIIIIYLTKQKIMTYIGNLKYIFRF